MALCQYGQLCRPGREWNSYESGVITVTGTSLSMDSLLTMTTSCLYAEAVRQKRTMHMHINSNDFLIIVILLVQDLLYYSLHNDISGDIRMDGILLKFLLHSPVVISHR